MKTAEEILGDFMGMPSIFGSIGHPDYLRRRDDAQRQLFEACMEIMEAAYDKACEECEADMLTSTGAGYMHSDLEPALRKFFNQPEEKS